MFDQLFLANDRIGFVWHQRFLLEFQRIFGGGNQSFQLGLLLVRCGLSRAYLDGGGANRVGSRHWRSSGFSGFFSQFLFGFLCGFLARQTLGFFLGFFFGDALLAELKALARAVGFFFFDLVQANTALGGAVILHQRNRTWADVRAGAALDAIEQVVGFEPIEIFRLCIPEQLLREQACRADFRADTAADTGLRGCRFRQFLFAGRKNTVGGLDDWCSQIQQGKSHHRPAHDYARGVVGIKAVLREQVANGGAEQHIDIALGSQCIAHHSGDSRHQRLAKAHSAPGCNGGADVDADDANVSRVMAAGNLAPGENLG